MRSATTLLASSLLLLMPACGGDDDGNPDNPDAGEPDATPPPPECADPDVGVICTIAGNGNPAYSGDDGPALDAEFSLPQDTLKGPEGLYILDWNNHRVRLLTPEGTIVHVAGRGELGGTLDDPAGDDFNHPTNIIFDSTGDNLLIAAWHNSKVRTIDPETGDVTENCGDGKRAYFGDEGPAATASFDLPAALVYDPDGNLVIMDQANQVIRWVDQLGKGGPFVHRLAGNCIIDGPTTGGGPGHCPDPTQCPAEGGTGRPSGKSTCGDPAATCGGPCNPTYAGGTVDTMRMSQPFGQSASPAGRIAYDADGNLLFADTGNSILRKIDTDGNVTIIAGLEPVETEADSYVFVPQSGYSGDEGPATDAKLNGPVDLAIGGDGTIYFTDVLNHCVRSIDGDGDIHTFAGTCGTKGHDGDGGPADEAHLKVPYGVEWSDGVLYIADTGNYVIRAIRTE